LRAKSNTKKVRRTTMNNMKAKEDMTNTKAQKNQDIHKKVGQPKEQHENLRTKKQIRTT
jgi:hypothetical protein